MSSDGEQMIVQDGVAAVAAIRSGGISAKELTTWFLNRIENANPEISALRDVIAGRALSTAKKIDRNVASGEDPGPLAGLPVVVKENCETVGARWSGNLEFLKNRQSQQDSWITSALERAGAVVLGTSISDPGAFDVRTPEVINPTDPTLIAGGSSGGSAAALAAGFCLGAIGTDTGGSIRIPSACCGTTGLKPSFGRLPMNGIMHLVPSLDHVGPMARNVRDVEMMWKALVDRGETPRKVTSVAFDPAWVNEAAPNIREEFEAFLKEIESRQIEVIECVLPNLDEVIDMHMTIFLVEAAAYHISNFNSHLEEYPKPVQQGFAKGRAISVSEYMAACERRHEMTWEVSSILEDCQIILTPTLPVVVPEREACTVEVNGIRTGLTQGLVRNTCLFDHTGHPALSIPFKAINGFTPASVQMIGGHFREGEVLEFAAEFGLGLLV